MHDAYPPFTSPAPKFENIPPVSIPYLRERTDGAGLTRKETTMSELYDEIDAMLERMSAMVSRLKKPDEYEQTHEIMVRGGKKVAAFRARLTALEAENKVLINKTVYVANILVKITGCTDDNRPIEALARMVEAENARLLETLKLARPYVEAMVGVASSARLDLPNIDTVIAAALRADESEE